MSSIFSSLSKAVRFTALAAAPLVLAHAAMGVPVQVAPPVKDLGGVSRAIPNRSAKATVLVFVASDCPISNNYAAEISRISSEYAKRGAQLMVVYADGDLPLAKARKHAQEYGFKMPLLLDAKHTLSRAVGATVTPEAVVLGPDGRRLYNGRIDNRYAGYGKTRKNTTERDLRVALDAVLAGKPVKQPVTKAIGCFIPSATP